MTERSDVDGILAALPEHYWETGEDPWGGANLDAGERYEQPETTGPAPVARVHCTNTVPTKE
jgi:hypothetical protein